MSETVAHLTAFYTTHPFWAGERPDFLDAPGAKYHKLVSEEVFQYNTDAFDLRFCKDGMIMLRMHALEAEHDPLHESGDFGKTLKWWGRYLDYANTVCLLLD